MSSTAVTAATSLFDEMRFFDYKFPPPQYLGAKYLFLPWIADYIPSGVETALDAFSGSQSVSYLFKQWGIRTITNDFLSFNHQIGTALIENHGEKLSDSDITFLFSPSPEKREWRLMENLYTGIFFEREDAEFIDNFRANVQRLKNRYKRALALTVMNRSLTRKVTMGHFAHTRALIYAKNPERIKRNRSLVRPVRDLFLDILPSYNNAVFDNGKTNLSYRADILDLLPQLDDVDLVYFDPPYCGSHADYQNFYHLLETYTEYWRDKDFVNGIKRYEPQRVSGFDKKVSVISSFEQLFTKSESIPYWLISYNDRSYPDIETFEKLIKKFRKVKVVQKTYKDSRGGKGSVAGSREVLFVCSKE